MIKYYEEMVKLTLELNKKALSLKDIFFFKQNENDQLVIACIDGIKSLEIEVVPFHNKVVIKLINGYDGHSYEKVNDIINKKYPSYDIKILYVK